VIDEDDLEPEEPFVALPWDRDVCRRVGESGPGRTPRRYTSGYQQAMFHGKRVA
jgi:hypothetical protein